MRNTRRPEGLLSGRPHLEIYYKHSPHELDWFDKFMLRHPELVLFQPNPAAAPWHVQAWLDNGELLNFWPHVVKGMIQDRPPVKVGVVAIEEMVAEAKTYMDDFDVIE